jgi:sugar O-acyltransferase (sialic acid O-acetyltransferase NeuD family)
MSNLLVILGTGGSAYDVLDIIDAQNRLAPSWQVAGFLDDQRAPGSSHLGFPILGKVADAPRLPGHYRFINVIGSDRSYQQRPDILRSTGLAVERFATLIHPQASVSSRAQLGHGVYVCNGASIAGAVRIGDHATLTPGVIIGHDTVIEDFALLAPAAVVSGFCRIGKAAYVGAGAIIRQRVAVGDFALVGMGAVVLENVPMSACVVGVPAKPLQKHAETELVSCVEAAEPT